MYELAYQSWIGIGTFTSADSQALPRMHTSAKTVYVDLQTTMIADMCIQLHIRVWYILWQDIFVSAASSMHLWKPASGHSRSHFHPKVIIHTTWRHCVYCAHYSATGRTWDTFGRYRDVYHTHDRCPDLHGDVHTLSLVREVARTESCSNKIMEAKGTWV